MSSKPKPPPLLIGLVIREDAHRNMVAYMQADGKETPIGQVILTRPTAPSVRMFEELCAQVLHEMLELEVPGIVVQTITGKGGHDA